MSHARIYADFQNLDNENRLRLTCAGTFEDLKKLGVELREGLVLTFYTDDEDDDGNPDELFVDGTVRFNDDDQLWVAEIDWNALRHASQSQRGNGNVTTAR
ncbi:MAG: hypothetical protein L0Y72_20925 [Gemmataceae bacterium]|nr:hypothetical protein [Gemmataceae bacterium]MCI0741505.1 hypothetical protein [Gemmataceae bacterium]